MKDSATANYIINTNKSLYSQTGAQIVVVTIPSLGNNFLPILFSNLLNSFYQFIYTDWILLSYGYVCGIEFLSLY